MKSVKDLKDERASKMAALEGLTKTAKEEKRSFKEEEQTKFDTLYNEVEDLDKQIERAEKVEKMEARSAAAAAGSSADNGKFSENEKKDIRNYSILKMVRSQMGKESLSGLEKELHQEAEAEARNSGTNVEGVGIPSAAAALILKRGEKRDMDVTTNTQGGFFVQTDVSDDLIDALRPKLVLANAGAQIMGGLVGDIDIPSNGGVSVTWKAENGTADETTPTIGRVQLSPKRLTGFTDISKQLIRQTSWSVEAMVSNDFRNALAASIDAAAIEGGGSNEPTGILSTSGIGDVAGGTNGAAPDWDDIVNLEREVAIDNADMGALAYLTNAKVRAKLKGTAMDAGSGRFVWPETESQLNGYRAYTTNNVPSDLTKGSASGVCSAIIFGNFNDLLIGNWGGVDLVVDPYTLATTGQVRLIAAIYVDAAVRRAVSFAAMKDALTT